MSQQPEQFEATSASITDDQEAKLKSLFPEIVTEGGKIDFDRLRLTLGRTVDNGKERYGMSWPGKADCFKTIQRPSMATLVPARGESVNFDTTENLIIEGDNLEVLKLLQKAYLGKVQMIYVDPPYNTGSDFIYPDDYSESLDTYLRYTGQVDAEGRKFSTNTEADGRFHSKWMNMMYPRLFLARNLLREDGVIFISNDDHENDNLRKLCNEIFGEENFIAQFVWNTEGHTDNQFDVKVNHEYVVLYARDARAASLGHVVDPNTRQESNLWKGFAENSITKNGAGNPPSEITLTAGFPCQSATLNLPQSDVSRAFFSAVEKQGYVTREMTDEFSVTYPIRLDSMRVVGGKLEAPCRVFSGWANANKLRAFIEGGFQPLDDDGDKVSFYLSEKGVIYYRRDREKARNIMSVLRNMGTTEKMRSELEQMGVTFQYPKPKELLKYLVQIGADKAGIVFDFFAGSGTTAHAVLEQNAADKVGRNFVLVQLPEPTERKDLSTIAEITKERVRRAIKKLNEARGNQSPLEERNQQDRGFRVFKLQSSNFKAWNSEQPKDDAELAKQLLLHVDHLIAGRTQEDVLYELLLKSGFPLTTKAERITLAGKSVFSVADGAMLICLEKDLTPEVIKEMAEKKPERVVCLDAGFADNDQLKTNAVQTMKAKGVTKFQTV
jgi:adenine-specific DNA-methyltransferase